jgi:hypothetical protein
MMNISKKTGALILSGIVVFGGLQLLEQTGVGKQLGISGLTGFVSTAEARVGRPLTPVSVGGVARRTVRRCAVGVYNC